MYELQLFDADTRQYVPVMTGEQPHELMKQGREHDGPRRVVSLKRGEKFFRYGKQLPLKPRAVYRRPTRHRLGTAIETPAESTILSRAIEHYRKREGKEPVQVYYWRGSGFGMELHAALQHGNFRFVALDPYAPGSAFGPDCVWYDSDAIAA